MFGQFVIAPESAERAFFLDIEHAVGDLPVILHEPYGKAVVSGGCICGGKGVVYFVPVEVQGMLFRYFQPFEIVFNRFVVSSMGIQELPVAHVRFD